MSDENENVLLPDPAMEPVEGGVNIHITGSAPAATGTCPRCGKTMPVEQLLPHLNKCGLLDTQEK